MCGLMDTRHMMSEEPATSTWPSLRRVCDGRVEQFRGWVLLGSEGKIERVERYFGATEARAAADRLAAQRG
jgi:hypothetical protein